MNIDLTEHWTFITEHVIEKFMEIVKCRPQHSNIFL